MKYSTEHYINKVITVDRTKKAEKLAIIYTTYDVEELIKQATKFIRQHYPNKINPLDLREFLLESTESTVKIKIRIRRPNMYLC